MSQPAYKQPENEFVELPVGEILRRTRLHYNKTIEDVEAALRIQSKQIHAIEIGDIKAFPARVYAIGFVRSYAEYLGLDGDKIVSLFKAQSETNNEVQTLSLTESRESKKAPPIGFAVSLFVVFCAILVITLGASDKQDIEPEIVPEVPKELKVEALEEKQDPVVTQPKPPPERIVEKPKGIVLKLVNNSWVEIRDQNGRKLVSRVLKAGDQYFVPDRLGLSMSIGNAGGVEILVDGEPLQNLGNSGQVLRNIPLNADALKERFPKPIDNQNENP